MRKDRSDLVWRALADPARRRILDMLRDRARTTGQLATAFPKVTRFAVMKHLGVLEDAGLVVVRPRGRERWHHLNAVPLRRAYERWMRPYADESAAGLLRLQRHVEGGRGGKGRTMGAMETDARTALGYVRYEQEIHLAASRERVFDALTTGVGEWFSHRMVAGSPVVCEPRMGGRVYEDWGDGQGHVWDVITGFKRPSLFRTESAWGLAGPVQINTTHRLDEAPGDGTLLKVSTWIAGELSEEGRASYASVLDALGPSLERYLAETA